MSTLPMLALKLYHPQPGSSLELAPGPACDQCRRKKARCNRETPCGPCRRSGTTCSYTDVPKVRGRRPRKGNRSEHPPISQAPFTAFNVTTCGTNGSTLTFDLEGAHLPLQDFGAASEMPLKPLLDSNVLTSYDMLHVAPGADASPGNTGPHAQQVEAIQTYPAEVASVSRYPQADTPDSGSWTHSSEAQDIEPSLPCMLHRSDFIPYVQIFLQRLYPVFPVVDREALLDVINSQNREQPIPLGLYAFLTALSAAVVVQLNVADPMAFRRDVLHLDGGDGFHWVLDSQPAFSAQFFVSNCMQARQKQDFIEDPDEWTILTSFFLFAYHGNMNQSKSAWYYLREAIGFIHALRLDEQDAYAEYDQEKEQRCKRLFWLLFITERAYAIQHRRRTVLKPTIPLPRVFESQDPKLAYGFVTLAKLFATVDESFVTAWTDEHMMGQASMSQQTNQSIAKLLNHDEVSGALSVSEIHETQRLDIMVTKHWLRILACQLQKGSSAQSLLVKDNRRFSQNCDIANIVRHIGDTSRSLLHVISSATPASLESHGIGMEQKIADVANCLCDMLPTQDDENLYGGFFSAPDCLHNFMVFLAGFRNHESQYLEPIVKRASTILAAKIHPGTLLENIEGRSPDDMELRVGERLDEDVGLLI